MNGEDGSTQVSCERPHLGLHGIAAAVLGFHIGLRLGTVYRLFAKTHTDLDPTQTQVLWSVVADPGITQAERSAQQALFREEAGQDVLIDT